MLNNKSESEPLSPPPEAFAAFRKSHPKNTSSRPDSWCKTLTLGSNAQHNQQQYVSTTTTPLDNEKENTNTADIERIISDVVLTDECLQVGDHIYVYEPSSTRVPAAVPFASHRRHAIITSSKNDGSDIFVVTFGISSKNITSTMSSSSIQQMSLESFTKGSRLYRVHYSTTSTFPPSRPSVVIKQRTHVKRDPPSLVLSRVHFLLENPTTIQSLFANVSSYDECASVWCCTGHFITLQASSLLYFGNVVQMEGKAVTSGLVAGTATAITTSPASPIVGGIVACNLSLTIILPCLIALGASSFISFEMLKKNMKGWDAITGDLNHFFSRKYKPVKIEPRIIRV